jgi:translation initiation factor 3 subunit H
MVRGCRGPWLAVASLPNPTPRWAQDHIPRCVCLIYDPVRSSQGGLHFKALRLTSSFMELYRGTDFTASTLADKMASPGGLPWSSVFAEIPVVVTNSALAASVLGLTAASSGQQPQGASAAAFQGDAARLAMGVAPFLERHLEFLNECMDDLGVEAQKTAYHSRSVARQQQQQAAWVQKRRAENAARKAAGQEALPEEEPGNPIFKALQEPSKLDTFLIINQVSNYCAQAEEHAQAGVSKLTLAHGLGGA